MCTEMSRSKAAAADFMRSAEFLVMYREKIYKGKFERIEKMI